MPKWPILADFGVKKSLLVLCAGHWGKKFGDPPQTRVARFPPAKFGLPAVEPCPFPLGVLRTLKQNPDAHVFFAQFFRQRSGQTMPWGKNVQETQTQAENTKKSITTYKSRKQATAGCHLNCCVTSLT